MAISNIDIEFIKQQLGRSPRGVLEISVRKNAKPIVIKTAPLINSQVFPTLYYLIDKELIEKVSTLESQSLLAKLQEKVDSDKIFRDKFLEAQKDYQKERNNLINLSQLSESQKEALDTGIGGVKDRGRIKCLHAHLAHHLATNNNPIGHIVQLSLRGA